MAYLPRSWSCWWWASWWCRGRPTWCARLSPPAPTPSSGWPSPPPSGCWAPPPPGPSSSSYPCFSRPRAAETSKCIFVFWRMIQGHFKVVVFVSILEMKYPKIFEKNFKHVFLMSGLAVLSAECPDDQRWLQHCSRTQGPCSGHYERLSSWHRPQVI